MYKLYVFQFYVEKNILFQEMMEGWRNPLQPPPPPPFLYGSDIGGHIGCESPELTGNQLLKQTSFCYHKNDTFAERKRT